MKYSEQKKICDLMSSAYRLAPLDAIIGVAVETLNLRPIHGVRVKPEGNESGWYIWGGDYSPNDDFFKPVHQSHMSDLLPFLNPYFALDYGYKFIVNEQDDYVDIWYEAEE
ncbi:immunity protein Imm33 domain-containing protein [Pseudomonas mangiferae]|uniref:Imm33-like domain-containing protein n=1 Tax=Pseudomonas mangiferae TaxID=2593654 RepID=A0A553GZ77_9PSED|nr:hypothetical protein [Pseudomonas mangiferae]TRX74776.1 hypothetical protein FM069_09560 [Pseudomonas mangiferae]